MNETADTLFKIFDRMTPMVYALVPALLAVIIFFGAKRMKKPNLKWLAFIPLAIGVILGIMGMGLLNDPLYNQMNLIGTRSELIYKAIPIIPVVVGIALVVINKLGTREMYSDL
jgi:hypothetical protein